MTRFIVWLVTVNFVYVFLGKAGFVGWMLGMLYGFLVYEEII